MKDKEWYRVAAAALQGFIAMHAHPGSSGQPTPEEAVKYAQDCADAFAAEVERRVDEEMPW